ncbi:hypothetical protein ACFLXK_03700 [Chloroflexota bacterium]
MPITDILKVEVVPADLIWQGIVTITKELNLFGEDGGGQALVPPPIVPARITWLASNRKRAIMKVKTATSNLVD